MVDDPIYVPSFGDLWMPTWTDDDRLLLTWGDGTGSEDGYPTGHPQYTKTDVLTFTECEEGDEFCTLWCNLNTCEAEKIYPVSPLTDSGVLVVSGV